jgi:hypothetical protein
MKFIFGLFRHLLLLLALATSVFAHDPFEMTAEVRVRAARLDFTVTMTGGTAMALIKKELPAGTRPKPENFEKIQPMLAAAAGNIFEVLGDDVPLALLDSSATLTPENDIEFKLAYAPPAKSPLRIEAIHVQKLGYGYGATITVTDDHNHFLGQKLLMGDDLRMEVALQIAGAASGSGATAADSGQSPSSVRQSAWDVAWSYVKLGVEHIVTGYDHLLFLAALLVVCRSFRSVAIIVSCFTLAHSLTLALASMDLVRVPSRVVEPLIAVTIVFVAVENFFRRGQGPRGRGWLTFTFGLIHGFGFATVLRQTGLGQNGSSLVVPLVSFNVGVELGQIAIAAVVLPIWWKLRTVNPINRYGAYAVSGVVALAGMGWLLQRTVL